MSKRDYVAIAKLIALSRRRMDHVPLSFVMDLIRLFEKDNAAFDRSRFLVACQVIPDEK